MRGRPMTAHVNVRVTPEERGAPGEVFGAPKSEKARAFLAASLRGVG